MSRINRVPEGLQSLLNSQNFGDNPSELANITQPTLELSGFFRKTLLRRGYVAQTVTAVGGNTSLVVPEGEIWEPLMCCVLFINLNAAGARATAQVFMGSPDEGGAAGLVEHYLYSTEVPTILNAASTDVRYGKGYLFPRMLLVGPGSYFNVRCTDLDLNGGTSVNMRLSVTYVRLKA